MVVCSSATLHASIRPPLRPSALLSEVSLKHYWRRSEWEAAAAAPSRKESEAGERARAPRLQRERGARKGRKRPLSLFLSLPIPLLHLSGAVTAGNPKEASKPLLPVSLSVSLSQCSRRVRSSPARPRPPVIAPKDSTLQQRASARPRPSRPPRRPQPPFPPRSHSSSLQRTGNGRADRPRRRSELQRWVRSGREQRWYMVQPQFRLADLGRARAVDRGLLFFRRANVPTQSERASERGREGVRKWMMVQELATRMEEEEEEEEIRKEGKAAAL